MAELTMSSGRTIALREFRQYSFYEGLLEGLPTRERNRSHLELIVEREQTRARSVHVIEPVETPIELEREYPFGEPTAWPAIVCVARFVSSRPTRDEAFDYSELTVVWFQPNFALPIESGVEAALTELDWDAIAADERY